MSGPDEPDEPAGARVPADRDAAGEHLAVSLPHARFPWLQAAFCAACVGMAAWLWMRYSYAWSPGPYVLDARRSSEDYYSLRWPYERHVRIEGTVLNINKVATDRGDVWCNRFMPEGAKREMFVSGLGPCRTGNQRLCGRLLIVLDASQPHMVIPILDTQAIRFTGESVAGLVVGAMGAFVFALYLRRWLLERRTVRHVAAGTGGA